MLVTENVFIILNVYTKFLFIVIYFVYDLIYRDIILSIFDLLSPSLPLLFNICLIFTFNFRLELHLN